MTQKEIEGTMLTFVIDSVLGTWYTTKDVFEQSFIDRRTLTELTLCTPVMLQLGKMTTTTAAATTTMRQ
ncbi:hypothetical protein LSH36_165g01041 [Paralvinella palmiformis]|uniref:Uncharacterized protein n=1 Tax=Paralvinella palmiformis TaxID=53620 RepID=A0AAD9N958_9ANNE|nr:hypothetical protein LSH36_165g01041 [Paralvinella palmiformis]